MVEPLDVAHLKRNNRRTRPLALYAYKSRNSHSIPKLLQIGANIKLDRLLGIGNTQRVPRMASRCKLPKAEPLGIGAASPPLESPPYARERIQKVAVPALFHIGAPSCPHVEIRHLEQTGNALQIPLNHQLVETARIVHERRLGCSLGVQIDHDMTIVAMHAGPILNTLHCGVVVTGLGPAGVQPNADEVSFAKLSKDEAAFIRSVILVNQFRHRSLL